ncbi:MAG: potassium channel family protein [Anaerolineae bacterium]|nr:potassium channel family protein [Anaerolineae bacterium]
MSQEAIAEQQDLHRERWVLLQHINAATDKPMIALAFVWLGLLILDFTRGLGPLLQTVSNVIWVIFILDFALEIVIAPNRLRYLRRHWLTAVSLVLPALRILRIFQAFRALAAVRAVRTVGLLRLITSVNRGMGAIGRTLGKRNIGFVIALTIIVIFVGAAGIAAFENPAALREAGHAAEADRGGGIRSYGEGVWWAAMIAATMGSDYWPKTAEGRILCWLLALYAFATFGYVTATIASHFVGQDRETEQTNPPDQAALQTEIAALRTQLAELSQRLNIQDNGLS